MTDVAEKVRAACGNVHLWVLGINFGVTAVLVGIAWGTLSADVAGIHREMDRIAGLREAWWAEEHKTDDIHRDRMNQIQAQIFDILKMMAGSKRGVE